MRHEINYLDLFSGIGGFRLGLHRAGFRFSWAGHSEIDRYAESIYRRHFPESEALGDIKGIGTEDLPGVDLVTFGFPCQDLSVAGRRKGLHSSRSGLFFEAMRIIQAARPKVFIFENVQGLLHSNDGRDFETVLRQVAHIGLYDCEGQLLNTSWVLPQNRERFYFIGHLGGASGPKVFPFVKGNAESQDIRIIGATRGQSKPSQRVQSHRGISCALTSSCHDFVADPRYYIDRRMKRLRRRRLPDGRITLRALRRRARRLTPVEWERLQGFPDGWTEFGTDEAGHEVPISNAQRYKTLGNAVSVPIVQAIGEALLCGVK